LARNKNRVGSDKKAQATDSVAATQNLSGDGPLTFSTPSEFVELPTEGKFYPETHPLHNKDNVEIKHMTAKEEDILSSKSLLKKGVALDRFMQSVIVDKNINVQDLYIGDRNAILIAARVTGYGEEYTTQVTCPACVNVSKFTFDLEEKSIDKGGDLGEEVTWTDNGTFITTLPVFEVDVELRMLTGKDESYLTRLNQNKKGKDLPDSSLTDQLKMTIVSVNGRTDPVTIRSLVEHLPAKDSKHLRRVYAQTVPNVNLRQTFECSHCSYEDVMEVPLNAEFFWPK